jgi:hypothetical protein
VQSFISAGDLNFEADGYRVQQAIPEWPFDFGPSHFQFAVADDQIIAVAVLPSFGFEAQEGRTGFDPLEP